MSKNDHAESIERGIHSSAAHELQNFIAQNPDIIGGADIYNLDLGTPVGRAGTLAAVLTGVSDQDRRPVVCKYVIVVPPDTNPTGALEVAWTHFNESFEVLAKRQLDPAETIYFQKILTIEIAADRDHSSVTRIIDRQSERTAIIVTEAASYRSNMVEPFVAKDASTPLLPEDIWVPQLHSLASVATRLAEEKTVYVALDSHKLNPRRQELSDLLCAIERCGVMASTLKDDPETILASHIGRWDTWIREGRLGRALQDLEALPSSLDQQKGFLRIQLLYHAGHLDQAVQAIRDWLRIETNFDGNTRVKLARIAQDANASGMAVELLGPVANTLDDREDLESSLAIASEVRQPELEEIVAERLRALFPTSTSLHRWQVRQFVRDRKFARAATVVRNLPDSNREAIYYETLDRYFSTDQVPDYQALIAEAGCDSSLRSRLRMACVSDALARNLFAHAFEFAMPIPSTQEQAQRGEHLLLKTLEALLLATDSYDGLPVSHDRFQMAVLALVERLAANPTNHALRIGLIELMQPSVAGSTGLTLMALLVLELCDRPIELQKRRAISQAGMEWLTKHQKFVKDGFAWMKAEEPMVIGRTVLPANLLTVPPDEVVSAVADFLAYAPPGTFEDTSAMLTWLAFGAAVAPHSSDPNYDLRLIRLQAGKLASAGNHQRARDLAEQALINSSTSPCRRRLGWFAMADVYGRGGNYIEALLAMACTFAADNKGDEEEIFQELSSFAQLLRDCGLLDQAQIAIGKARSLLRRMGLLDEYGHQLDTLELQLRQRSWEFEDDPDAALSTLLVDVLANGRNVIHKRGFTAPVGALLGQLLRTARLRGLSVPSDADAVFSELQGYARGAHGQLVGMMSAVRPTSQELLAFTQALGVTRYSDDVGFDTQNLSIAASRTLASDDLLKDPESTAFVLDLLADRGVALPGWDEAPMPAPPPSAVSETAEIACAISAAGISIVQAGFNENGHLVRLATIEGRTCHPTIESAEVILEERMKQWSVEFPFAYGIDENTTNLFYTTTANLRLSELPDGPVVIVADAKFQAFPPNLIFIDGDFAGRTRPMAAAPSISWLGCARGSKQVGNGQMCAWISTTTNDDNQTLPMVAERLQPVFEAYDFIVDNGPVLPVTLAGTTLAVVTAHGSVHPEGRYFHVVSDEGGLRMTAADLANALRNVDVVVLFVCSGGRTDKHPVANTTLGLAKRILDRGCSAVIASPWPLDARVPSHWLPVFLEHWTQGATLIEANFNANQAVDQQFAQDPARGLAMTVYGDPAVMFPFSKQKN